MWLAALGFGTRAAARLVWPLLRSKIIPSSKFSRINSLDRVYYRLSERLDNSLEMFSKLFARFVPEERQGRPTEEQQTLAQRYYRDLQLASVLPIISIIILCVLAVRRAEYSAGAILAMLLTAQLAHVLLTRYRIQKGLFGSNVQEVSELISYLIEQTHNSGLPPGTHVSNTYSHQTSTAQSFDGETVGVRT
jgi:hypothetical protein